MRTFIALDLAAGQKRQLYELQQRLARYLHGVKWTGRQGLHLTLKFLGEVGEECVPALLKALEEAAATTPVFTISFKGTGVFPAPHRARVLWAGVGEGAAPVSSLAAALNSSLAGQGFAPERRPFVPHLTLGRLRYPLPTAQIERFLLEEKNFSTGRAVAAGATLYRSDLSRQGPTYTALGTILFG